MRLIDEDLLIQDLHHGIFDDCDCKKDYEYLGIDDYIRNQPTAFNLESVIEQINSAIEPTECWRHRFCKNMSSAECVANEECGFCVAQHIIQMLKSAANATNGKNGG